VKKSGHKPFFFILHARVTIFNFPDFEHYRSLQANWAELLTLVEHHQKFDSHEKETPFS